MGAYIASSIKLLSTNAPGFGSLNLTPERANRSRLVPPPPPGPPLPPHFQNLSSWHLAQMYGTSMFEPGNRIDVHSILMYVGVLLILIKTIIKWLYWAVRVEYRQIIRPILKLLSFRSIVTCVWRREWNSWCFPYWRTTWLCNTYYFHSELFSFVLKGILKGIHLSRKDESRIEQLVQIAATCCHNCMAPLQIDTSDVFCSVPRSVLPLDFNMRH